MSALCCLIMAADRTGRKIFLDRGIIGAFSRKAYLSLFCVPFGLIYFYLLAPSVCGVALLSHPA